MSILAAKFYVWSGEFRTLCRFPNNFFGRDMIIATNPARNPTEAGPPIQPGWPQNGQIPPVVPPKIANIPPHQAKKRRTPASSFLSSFLPCILYLSFFVFTNRPGFWANSIQSLPNQLLPSFRLSFHRGVYPCREDLSQLLAAPYTLLVYGIKL